MAATTKLNPKTVRKVVNALLKWRNSQVQSQNSDPLDDEFVYLVLTLNKIPPKSRVNAYKLPLPNPLLSEFTEFCLIYDDTAHKKLTHPQIEKKIKSHDIPITKVLKLSKLKSDYKSFEDKQKLMSSYDVFLAADKEMLPLLPRLLGKGFYKKKDKIPVAVDLRQRNWKEQVDEIRESSWLYLSTGTCCVVRVGKCSMSVDEIVENLVAAVDGIVEIVPKGWKGVRSFHLKLLESLPLPVYQAVPDETLLKIEGVKKSGSKELNKSDQVGGIGELRYLDRNVLDEDGIVKKKSTEATKKC